MVSKKESVRLREKVLKSGVRSLYLDIYRDGKRSYEFLKLYLNPGNDPYTRTKNKSTLELARVMQAQKLIDVETSPTGVITTELKNLSFVSFYKDYYSNRSSISERYRRSSDFALARWIAFAGEDMLLSEITPQMLSDFAVFLKETKTIRKQRMVLLRPYDGGEESYMPLSKAEVLVLKMTKKDGMSAAEISQNTGILEPTPDFGGLILSF